MPFAGYRDRSMSLCFLLKKEGFKKKPWGAPYHVYLLLIVHRLESRRSRGRPRSQKRQGLKIEGELSQLLFT